MAGNDDASTVRRTGAADTDLVITDVSVATHSVPTSTPSEQDATMEWNATTIVVVTVTAGPWQGLGFTYGPTAVAVLVADDLAEVIEGRSAIDVRARWLDLYTATRNLGRPGVASLAISAIDIALWDLKARALEVSLVDLWGGARDGIDVYGSGGFTNASIPDLCDQLTGWVDDGIPRVKMKVGRHPDQDPTRVAAARRAVGPDVAMMVDANGGYTVEQASGLSRAFGDLDVVWHEEPVSSNDLAGLRRVRESTPPGMAVAAGEYCWDAFDARDLVMAGAVDCLQADVTRCGGFTGFFDIASLCWAHEIDLSAHCAPNLSMHPCVAAPRVRHVEYFHDHVRIERGLFDGTVDPVDGQLRPDRDRPGHGLSLRPGALDTASRTHGSNPESPR